MTPKEVDEVQEPEAATEQPEPYLAPWHFETVGELVQALREYTALLDSIMVRRYGKPDEREEEGRRPAAEEDIDEYERTVWRQRSTIDLGMEILEERWPRHYRLLDSYYRHGLVLEPKGWLLPMARMGLRTAKCPPLVRCTLERGEWHDNRLDLPKCQAAASLCCMWDWQTFRVQLSLATEALLFVIQTMQGVEG